MANRLRTAGGVDSDGEGVDVSEDDIQYITLWPWMDIQSNKPISANSTRARLRADRLVGIAHRVLVVLWPLRSVVKQ